MRAGSVFSLLNLLHLFHVVKFLLVLLERLRQDGVTSCRCRSIEVFLQLAVHALVALNKFLLSAFHKLRTRLFLLDLVCQYDLVVLLDALHSLQILLLDPSAVLILGLFGVHGLVEHLLAVGHLLRPVFNASPALLKRLVALS